MQFSLFSIEKPLDSRFNDRKPRQHHKYLLKTFPCDAKTKGRKKISHKRKNSKQKIGKRAEKLKGKQHIRSIKNTSDKCLFSFNKKKSFPFLSASQMN